MKLSTFLSCKGQFIKASFRTTQTPCKASKGVCLEKATVGTFRAGIDFAHLLCVKEGIASGERGEVQPLSWGEWEHFPYTITHNGARYYRLYPVEGGKLVVERFVDGMPATKEAWLSHQPPSAATTKPAPPCFVVREDHLVFEAE